MESHQKVGIVFSGILEKSTSVLGPQEA